MALTTDHFRHLVDSQTNQLNELCRHWDQFMQNDSDITEDGFGQIRSTIGKTHLFINQRFKQFVGLIDDCDLKRGPKETKVEDLEGFWDMIYFQVIELHNNFDFLVRLRDNNWVEMETKTEKPMKKKIATKMVCNKPESKTTVKSTVRSSIREQIKSMKANKVQLIVDKNESFGEKENKKIENPIKSGKDLDSNKLFDINKKINERMIYECNQIRNVGSKRTPLMKK